MFDQRFFVSLFNNKRLWFVFVATVFYFFCVYEYKAFVVRIYGYMGFEFHFDVTKTGFSLIIFFLCFFYLWIKNSDFIRGFSALFHVLFVMPNLVMYQFMEMDVSYLVCTLFLLVLINLNIGRITLPHPPEIVSSEKSIYLMTLSILVIIPFFFLYKINWNPSFFLMGSELYDVRADIKGSGNFFTSYMLSPVSQVLLPICVIYGLRERNWTLVTFSVVSSVLLFLMIPQKTIFFGIFVVIFFYFFNSSLKKVLVFTSLLFGILLFGKFMFLLNGHLMTESLFLRRYLLIPAYLNIVYFDFFHDSPIYFSHGFLSNYIEYPFDRPPSNLIGFAAFGSYNTHANNGFLSDGFMNLGYLGMYVFTLIFSFVIRLFDSINISSRYFGLFFLLLNLFRSSALFTTLVTHGVWLLVLVAYFFLYRVDDKKQSPYFDSGEKSSQ